MQKKLSRPALRKKLREKSGNKFHNHRTMLDGIRFDSKKEAYRYAELRSLESAGQIRNLVVKPRYEFTLPDGTPLRYPATPKRKIGRKVTHTPDFKYVDLTEGKPKTVVEDVKGYDYDMGRLKRALMLGFHGITIQLV